MGTWGPGTLEDDVAADVQLMFEDALSGGMSAEQASLKVLRELPGEMSTDDDDGPVILLALAALQLQHQALDPHVRDLALSIISSGGPMDRWSEATPDRQAARTQVLEEFAALLRRGKCTSAELQRVLDPDEQAASRPRGSAHGL